MSADLPDGRRSAGPGRIGFHARRHLAVWRQALVQAVGREAQFRAQAGTTLAVGLLQLALSLVPVALIFGRTGEVRGWSAAGVVAVVGTFQFGLGLLETFVAPNLTRMYRYVVEGELDTVLIRPVSAQLFTAFRWMQPAELPGALTGLVLAGFGLALAGVTPSPERVALAAAWFVLGVVAVTCFWANLAYVAFWSGSLSIDVALLLSPGQYPLRFFPRAIRGVLTFAVPIGVATTVPVRALEGRAPLSWLPAAAGLTVAALVITRVHWRLALRRYASASS